MSAPVAIILAAGKGTRMKSELPKVMHPACGRPMVEHVLDATRSAGVERLVVVVGYQVGLVRDGLSRHRDVEFALQAEQKGTGHAVQMCAEQLANHDGPVLILAGDTPLLRGESLAALLAELRDQHATCVIGTAITENNFGLGRVVRSTSGDFLRIVEQKDTTPEEAAIREINTGCYAFDGRLLFQALTQIRPNNSQGEYYLTDVPGILKAAGHRVIAAPKLTIEEAMGVNTPEQLADVESVLRRRATSK
ncbi:MAG: glycosyl transferase family 2 [Planctomycetota bacterium]|nr:MAG: glycosyl transferase family 2 [Planctomycetota bacterium]